MLNSVISRSSEWFKRVLNERILQKQPRLDLTKMTDFDPKTLPWIDRVDADVDLYVQSIPPHKLPKEYDLGEKLLFWRKFGFVIFEKAVSDLLIQAYLDDLKKLLRYRTQFTTLVTMNPIGNINLNQLTEEQLESDQMRFCDVHNVSVIGKNLSLHPLVVNFLEHVFRDQVVAMQSLTFIRGSQQSTHQDFAYVVSQIPSHLAASWVALEDVHPDAGPLGYYPGSHVLPKFNFGNGIFLTPESPKREAEFAKYLISQCRSVGLSEQRFYPKKGDILIWHGALAHHGSPVKDGSLTRRSYVTHYSSKKAYPLDRRNPEVKPIIESYNGGLVYRDPTRLNEENKLEKLQ